MWRHTSVIITHQRIYYTSKCVLYINISIICACSGRYKNTSSVWAGASLSMQSTIMRIAHQQSCPYQSKAFYTEVNLALTTGTIPRMDRLHTYGSNEVTRLYGSASTILLAILEEVRSTEIKISINRHA